MSSWVAALAVALFVPGTSSAGRPVSDLDALEQELRKAMAAGNYGGAITVADQLAATGEPRAYEVLIDRALAGVDYTLEKHVGGLLLGAENPGVRSAIYERIRAGKPATYKTRIILLAVAARLADDPAALGAIHAALDDPTKGVVLAALQWLERLKRPESVEPLIDALEARERRSHDRIYFDLLKALRAITGADLEVSIDWRNFWKAQKAGQTVQSRKKDGVTVLYKRPSFFSITVDSDRVLFVIDVSTSMREHDPVYEEEEADDADSGPRGKTVVKKRDPPEPRPAPRPVRTRERLQRVKEELVRVVNGLAPNVRFGILAFSHELRWFGGTPMLHDASSSGKAEATRWVGSLVPTGATRTDLALREALSLLEVDTVYVLTDGAPKDITNERLPIDPILDLAKHMNRFLRCRIHTISFEQIRDSRMQRFVQDLARQNDGVCTLLK